MTEGGRPTRRGITRREFLATGIGAGAGLVLLGGCGGGSDSSGPLTFMTWANSAEEKGFRGIIDRYQKKNPGAKVKLEIVPPEQMYEKLDTRLAAGEGPDLARIQYQAIGRYSSQGALVDLTDYLGEGYGDAFTPALWQSVLFEDKPYGVPQHTDTFALFYNQKIFDELGVEVPGSPEEGWTWDRFMEVARQVKDEGAAKYPFAMNWQGDGAAYRWMIYLFQRGGRLLSDDLKTPAINNAAGVDTIAFTQSWFTEKLVPPSTSIKSGELIETLFANGTIAMMLQGDWLMPFLADSMQDEWGVTYMIQDTAMASDLGGNAVAATADAKDPEAAAGFLEFLASDEEMKQFCIDAQFIPVRTSLVQEGLDYKLRPEDMDVFVKQSETVPETMAREQTFPDFNKVNQVLADELEAAFKTGQTPEDTAKNIESGITEALG
jgi:multiple sugar transport system substrate-binding protein